MAVFLSEPDMLVKAHKFALKAAEEGKPYFFRKTNTPGPMLQLISNLGICALLHELENETYILTSDNEATVSLYQNLTEIIAEDSNLETHLQNQLIRTGTLKFDTQANNLREDYRCEL
jgi:hypothetical protein